MQKKFELTTEFIEMYGRKLFRIKALIDFSNIKAGDLGGYIEKIDNLDQYGNAEVLAMQALSLHNRFNAEIVPYKPSITNVIFNDPATIVFWSDGTKTVVKAENEKFDPEKGLAMAICKRALGNKGNYYNEFRKWLPEEESKVKPVDKVDKSKSSITPLKNAINANITT
ncbi:MAG: hypothetical protein J6B01_04360 [Ruminococcus sp.]|nr:hypothetical protein [Ruminococcus sp.]